MIPRSIVVMGVSGSGKSTVGRVLGERLNCEFIDGDDLHTPESIKKMSEGTPLTDGDRSEWLLRINSRLSDASKKSTGIVIAASLLKAQYRTKVTAGIQPRPFTVLLSIPLAESIQRLAKRKDHFMPQTLAASQFDILDDTSEVDLLVDGTAPLQDIVEMIIDRHAIKQ